MSSLVRRIQRRALRKSPDWEGVEQPVIHLPDGGYRTLRPTRGWLTFSIRRLWAQQKVAAILDRVLPDRVRKPRKEWRQPAPPAPSVETRQQRRAAARK